MDFHNSFNKWLFVGLTIFILLVGIGSCGTQAPCLVLYTPANLGNLVNAIENAERAGLSAMATTAYGQDGCNTGCPVGGADIPNCHSLCYQCIDSLVDQTYNH